MGANFGDLDHDGWLDFHLGEGDLPFSELRPNRMFRSREGRRFDDVTMAGRFGHLQKGNAIAFADLDADGDEDVWVRLGGMVPGDRAHDGVFRNPGFGNRWITVKLTGRESNRSAIGARIRADFRDRGAVRSVWRWVSSGGSFGANPLRQTIGLGGAESIDVLEIYWPTTDRAVSPAEVPERRGRPLDRDRGGEGRDPGDPRAAGPPRTLSRLRHEYTSCRRPLRSTAPRFRRNGPELTATLL
jgi:hypothetical protein